MSTCLPCLLARSGRCAEHAAAKARRDALDAALAAWRTPTGKPFRPPTAPAFRPPKGPSLPPHARP